MRPSKRSLAASVKRRPASSTNLLDAFDFFYCHLLLEVPLKLLFALSGGSNY
jgi:hypothetical protein